VGFLPAFKRLPLREKNLCVYAEQLAGKGFFRNAKGNSCCASPWAEGADTKRSSCIVAACLRALERDLVPSALHTDP